MTINAFFVAARPQALHKPAARGRRHKHHKRAGRLSAFQTLQTLARLVVRFIGQALSLACMVAGLLIGSYFILQILDASFKGWGLFLGGVL